MFLATMNRQCLFLQKVIQELKISLVLQSLPLDQEEPRLGLGARRELQGEPGPVCEPHQVPHAPGSNECQSAGGQPCDDGSQSTGAKSHGQQACGQDGIKSSGL